MCVACYPAPSQLARPGLSSRARGRIGICGASASRARGSHVHERSVRPPTPRTTDRNMSAAMFSAQSATRCVRGDDPGAPRAPPPRTEPSLFALDRHPASAGSSRASPDAPGSPPVHAPVRRGARARGRRSRAPLTPKQPPREEEDTPPSPAPRRGADPVALPPPPQQRPDPSPPLPPSSPPPHRRLRLLPAAPPRACSPGARITSRARPSRPAPPGPLLAARASRRRARPP